MQDRKNAGLENDRVKDIQTKNSKYTVGRPINHKCFTHSDLK